MNGWAQASLRISSDSVSFEWITEQLGIQPDGGGNAGDPGPGRSTLPTTLWRLGSDLSKDRPLIDHINQLLAQLEGHRSTLAIVAEQCRLEIFAGVAPGTVHIGEILPWPTLKALAEHQLDLDPCLRRVAPSSY